MSVKISAAKRAAFLKAVAETGNQTLAAERAKVSRTGVTLHRSRDGGFDAAVRASLDVARSKLLDRARDERVQGKEGSGAPDQIRGDGRSNRSPARWRYLAGEEMVVRGTRSGQGRQEGHPRRWGRQRWVEPPIEEVRAEILRKMAAMERARKLAEGGGASGAAEAPGDGG